ncbi:MULTISPECIES: beta-ketoacyl synthase chain length factor [Cysteiniphilum]|uniref:beta-ketoacyl synthase chain length factor n=1 Tax=Cysteiniphilum TaxID=2056696 RepID=UPI00177B0112|nr:MULTISPECIES: beta-ketoacyl synthase chain length factor [Cysteiniphilum]
MTSFTFNLRHFSGMAPTLNTVDEWQKWHACKQDLPNSGDIATTHVPASLKRRSSLGVKQALEVALDCFAQSEENLAIDYTVFASQHGEGSRLQSLLRQIAQKELLSPMDFSQSVHNTASGLLSLSQGIKTNINSIAGGKDTFFMAVIEALTYLQLNPHSQVLLVIYDEPLAESYKSYHCDYDQQYACAFIIDNYVHTTKEGFTCRLNLSPSTKGETRKDISTETAVFPPALVFLAWVCDQFDNRLKQDGAFWQFNWYKNNGE